MYSNLTTFDDHSNMFIAIYRVYEKHKFYYQKEEKRDRICNATKDYCCINMQFTHYVPYEKTATAYGKLNVVTFYDV